MKELGLGALLGIVVFLVVLGVNLLPLLLFAALLALFMGSPALRGIGGRFKPVTAAPGVVAKVSFDDVGGQSMAKKELVEALDFICRRDLLRRLGIRPLRGILLTGPPGTGKTLLAKAAAGYTQSSFIAASGSEFIEVYAGVGAQRVRELFGRARRLAQEAAGKSAIVFIDEIEVLGGKRGKNVGHLEYDQTLNQLLVEMDGLNSDSDPQVLVVGATNRMDLLDSALLRPGRFDRVVRVGLPDRDGRLQILRVHTRGKPLAEDVDLDRVARETFGFSGAHLESLANEAAILAMRAGSEAIQQRHLLEAVDKVIMGEKMESRLSQAERERVAVHEVGHALVGEMVRPGSVSSVTIVSRGAAMGYVRQSPGEDAHLYTPRQLEEEVRLALAGAVAEEEVFGSRSTGAAADFDRATDTARRIVLCGLSPLGVVDGESLPRGALHRAMQRIIAEQEAAARAVVQEFGDLIVRARDDLLARETISGDDFRALLAGVGGEGSPVEGSPVVGGEGSQEGSQEGPQQAPSNSPAGG